MSAVKPWLLYWPNVVTVRFARVLSVSKPNSRHFTDKSLYSVYCITQLSKD